MNCKNCNNPLLDGAKFCGKCGTKVLTKPSQMVGTVKDKTIRGTRIALGIFLGLLAFTVFFKIIAFIVSIGGALGLGAFNLHVSEDEGLLRDVEAAANIIGFIVSAIIANKVYKLITKKNINPNTPARKKKWYQFGGFAK